MRNLKVQNSSTQNDLYSQKYRQISTVKILNSLARTIELLNFFCGPSCDSFARSCTLTFCVKVEECIPVINLTPLRKEKRRSVWFAGRVAANKGRRIKRKMETDYGATSRSIGG